MTVARCTLWILSLSLVAGCSAGSPETTYLGDEAADLAAAGAEHYALRVDDHRAYCLMDDQGECDASEDPASATSYLIFAVSTAEGTASPCRHSTTTHSGSTYSLDDDVIRSVPPGPVQAFLDGDTLDISVASAMGMDLDDPFTDEIPTHQDDPRVANHDGDRKAGITYNTPGPGTVYFGLRVAADASFSVTALEQGDEVHSDASMIADFSVYGGRPWGFDARTRISEMLAQRLMYEQYASMAMKASAGPGCRDALAAFDLD